MPSMLMRRKTYMILVVEWSSEKIPTADSYIKVRRIRNWPTAGRKRNFSGRGGMPSEIDEREIKTVD